MVLKNLRNALVPVLVSTVALITISCAATSSATQSSTQQTLSATTTPFAQMGSTTMMVPNTNSMPMGAPKMGTTTPVPPPTSSISATPTPVTVTGYITTEDDFANSLGKDTAGMVYMKMMAMSGLGVTKQKADGSWEFYFFDGKISTGETVNGAWAFNGTGSQLTAWNVIGEAVKTNAKGSVAVTVVGTVNGSMATNPGMDADGRYFPVIAVSSITAN
jgi:hypothetical protein